MIEVGYNWEKMVNLKLYSIVIILFFLSVLNYSFNVGRIHEHPAGAAQGLIKYTYYLPVEKDAKVSITK